MQNGRVEQSNFDDYPILRMHKFPNIEVIIQQNNEQPGGIGEPGVPPLAPALSNAIFVDIEMPVRQLRLI